MAIYVTDFSEYALSSAPSDWTSRWATDWTTNVISGSLSSNIGGKNLEIASSAASRKLLSWDALDGDANRDDIEVLARVQSTSTTSSSYWWYLQVRASGAAGNETGYRFAGGYLNKFYLAKYVAGVRTQLASVDFSDLGITASDTDNYPHWVRFRVNGSSLKLKVWSISQDEPELWGLETTDTDITSVGWAGVGADDPPGDDIFDYYAVGTNGDSPSLPVSSGESRLNALNVEVATASPADLQVNLNALNVEVAYSLEELTAISMPLICINS